MINFNMRLEELDRDGSDYEIIFDLDGLGILVDGEHEFYPEEEA